MKKAASKQRKDRKLAKKNPEWRSKLKKDPGIPNLFPYKERILQEIEEKKMKKAEEAQRRKEMAKAAKTESQGDMDVEGGMTMDDEDYDDANVDESNPMAALLASAKATAAKYDRDLGNDAMDEDDEDEVYNDSEDEENHEVSVGQASSRKTDRKSVV